MIFSNVLIIGHQSSFSADALCNMTQMSFAGVRAMEQAQGCENGLMITMLRIACG